MKSMAMPMETDGEAEPQMRTELAAMRAVVDELKARPSYAATVGGQGGWTTVPSRSTVSGSPELLQFTLTGIDVAEGLRGGELGELLVGTIKQRIGVSVQIANAKVLPGSWQHRPSRQPPSHMVPSGHPASSQGYRLQPPPAGWTWCRHSRPPNHSGVRHFQGSPTQVAGGQGGQEEGFLAPFGALCRWC